MTMKFLVSLPDIAFNALDEIMREDMQLSRSAYIARLVSDEKRRRDEAKAPKRGVGRPRKDENDSEDDEPDYTNDMPKNILHFGRMIGPRELNDIAETQKAFSPKN